MVAGIVNDMLYCAHRVPRVTRLYHDTPKKCMPVWDVIDTPHEQSNVLSGLQGFSVRSPSNISLQ